MLLSAAPAFLLRPVAVLLLLLLHGVPQARAEVGVNATHIIIGQTAALTGLQAEYGLRISAGLRVAFDEANAQGGVQSRNLTLISLDDKYNQDLSLPNFFALKDQVLLLAAVVGSAINARLLPYIVQYGVPSVGPLTGAPATRSPFTAEVVNVRASYKDEVVVHTKLLVETLRFSRIACFYQNDSMGISALTGLVAGLTYAGIPLAVSANYIPNTLDIEGAVEAIAGQKHQVQAVVMASLEEQNVKFIHLFRQDNRTDPNCTFLFISVGVTSAFASKVGSGHWRHLYFTNVVPPLDDPNFEIISSFQSNAARYMVANFTADHNVLEGYVVGRLIVEVLRGIPGTITRTAFLDQLYRTRLYEFGGLLVGMYSRNYSGCQRVICESNLGMRSLFPAVLNLTTGTMHHEASLPAFNFPVTEPSYPLSSIARPLLFGQLVPLDDPVWRCAAEAIGRGLQGSFSVLNAAGGIGGRQVQLIQRWYSGDAAPAAAAFVDRYPLLALVGSVVPQSTSLLSAPAQIGTYQTNPLPENPPFNVSQMLVAASMPLEIMALATFALQLGLPVHLRAPATTTGQAALELMVRSLHSLQLQPASSRTFTSAAEALEGLSSGVLLAIGSDEDVQQWFLSLAALPALHLLTTSPRAVHLLGSLNITTFPQADRFHYPNMFSDKTGPIPGPEVEDATAFGALLGAVLEVVLPDTTRVDGGLQFTTTEEVLEVWYGREYVVNGVTLGPYSSTACSATTVQCECNQGVRLLTVVTGLRAAEFHFLSQTCSLSYADLIVPAREGLWYIGPLVGALGGVAVLAALGVWLWRRGERDNAAAPKDPTQPFCILFTDIQASTHLWATIPDVMAIALRVHHTLIRKLLAKHQLYEVKTIGDSFMCATRSPATAVQFAVALQREFFAYRWGTDAIDTEYLRAQEGGPGWGGEHKGWNGLRVRVGIHYGMGDIELDPVSRGYDYYGTVVNTAARVEAVCHGGQIGVTQAVYNALKGELHGTVWTDLGEHLLRGLSEPLQLHQVLPAELGIRVFPPLRLQLVDDDTHVAGLKKDSILEEGGNPWDRHSVTTVATVAASWVLAHPLVRSGQFTAEDLTMRYHTVLKALTTLLGTQTKRLRELAVAGFCERLHVRHCGSDGPRLEETLHGLVQRVLPAALMAVPAGAGLDTVSISIDDMPPSPMLMPKTSMRQQSTSLLGLVPVENDIQAEDV